MKLITPLFKKPYIELENEQERELFNLDKDKEIERLKERLDIAQTAYLSLDKKIIKAIKYIEQESEHINNLLVVSEDFDIEELLDILKGDDSNE